MQRTDADLPVRAEEVHDAEIGDDQAQVDLVERPATRQRAGL
jgi:hypothetical protein